MPRSSRKRAGLCMLKRGASCLGCRKGKRRPPGRVLHPTQSTYFAAMDADGKGLNFFNGCVTGGGSIRHPRRRHWGRLVMHSIQRLLLCERSELYQQTSQQYRGSWRHQGWAEGSPIQTCQVYLDGGTLARKRGIDACSDTVMECSLASAYLASERTSQPQSTRIWSMKRVSASKCPFALGDEHGALTRTAAQVSAFARTPMLSVSVTLL